MMTDEEKKKVLEGLNNNKKKKQAYLQGVNYINELLRSGVIEDITFLKDLFRSMFQNTAKERFITRDERKSKRKNITRVTPETTFTLEKALINICYKYFNSDLFDILEKEINVHKKALGLELPVFLADFYNVYCSFGILKLKYFGVKIEDLDHFVKFCDPKYREKIRVLTKKNSPKETIDFNECFDKLKTYEEMPSESHSYFLLEDFYRLNSKIADFKFAKLANLSSFRNNFERQMKKCLEQIMNRKFTEAKSNLKELRKNDQYKNNIEIRLHINNLLILCHVELAEYFECDYYINLSIDEAMANDLKHVYFYFLNLKFAIERIGFIEGPRSCVKFDFEDIKERKLILEDFIKMNQVDLNTQLRDCKLTTQISLAVVKDDIRELRNLETYKFLDLDKLFMNIKILSQEYSIISLYVINDILHINLFDQILNTKINFKDFSSQLNTILAASRDILRRNVQSRKDKSDWWIDRLELESKLQKLLKDIKIDCKLMNYHVILILDEKSTNFPWEHTSFLKDKHVFRIPSLEYLNLKEMKRPVEGLSWIVDPDNNLEGTRKRILNYFDTKNLIKNEENFNVLLYFGHGGGSKYIKNIKNKILFLFGCCSSKILNIQNFKRNGKVLNHLEKENTLIGCLWEVTDKDLDMISMNIIDNLFNKKCLACIIKESISVAKLPYLNGCSLVVYGLPIILTKECE